MSVTILRTASLTPSNHNKIIFFDSSFEDFEIEMAKAIEKNKIPRIFSRG